jgi:hypothetical protein
LKYVVIPNPKPKAITTTEAEDNLPSNGAEAQTEPVPKYTNKVTPNHSAQSSPMI